VDRLDARARPDRGAALGLLEARRQVRRLILAHLPRIAANSATPAGATSSIFASGLVGGVWYSRVMDDKRREATYQDVLDAPEHMVAELIDGELLLSPRPAAPHASVATMLATQLVPPFCQGLGGPGGWIILVEPELHLGSRVLVPDYAGWRTASLPDLPDEAFFTTTPDWVCEIASPSTEKLDRKRKLPIYADAGIGHFWLIQPRNRTLEVMRLVDRRWSLLGVHSDGDKIRAEPFEGFELDLTNLWWQLPTRASEASALYG
jgi:Uma2 family endonuclease